MDFVAIRACTGTHELVVDNQCTSDTQGAPWQWQIAEVVRV